MNFCTIRQIEVWLDPAGPLHITISREEAHLAAFTRLSVSETDSQLDPTNLRKNPHSKWGALLPDAREVRALFFAKALGDPLVRLAQR